jgi:hypothetical protein
LNEPEPGDDDVMKIGDLAGILLRVGARICLAVVAVTGFELQSQKKPLSCASMDALDARGGSAISVSYQILDLQQDGTPTTGTRWIWTGKYIRFNADLGDKATHKQFILKSPGYLIHPLAPTIIPSKKQMSSELTYSTSAVTWALNESDLADAVDYSWSQLSPETEEIMANIELLPTVTNCPLPYTDENGKSCCVIKSFETNLQQVWIKCMSKIYRDTWQS